MNRTQVMILTLFLAMVLVSGCADNRFVSEKLFWQAEQAAAKIAENKTPDTLTDQDLVEIISAYRQVVTKCPLEPLAAKAQFVIAAIYISQKEYEKAREEFRRVIENFSYQSKTAAAAQFAIGEVFELQGKSKQAFAEYEKVADLYPLSALGFSTPLYIAQYYKKIGDKAGEERAYRQAVRHYKKIIGEYADTNVAGIAQNYLAKSYVEREDWSQAMKVWDEIIIKYPNTPQAIRGLMAKAETRAKELNDLAGAITIYQDFLKDYPRKEFIKEVKLRLGELYLKNSQAGKAKEVFSAIIKDYPKDEGLVIRGRLGLISCLREQGSTEEIIQGYNTIKKAYPDSPIALSAPYLIFRYYKQTNDSENTEAALDKAISEYEKGFSPAIKGGGDLALAKLLFLCYTEKKDWDKALSLLRELSDNNKKDPGYLLSMAFINLKELGKVEEAKKIYREVLDKHSSNKALVKLIKEQIVYLDESIIEGN